MSLELSWPYFAEDEIAAVENVLKSGRVSYWTGEQGRLFEKEFADFIGVDYAVAMANGTVTLEAALRVLGIGPDDEVIVPCKTFVATASAVMMVGATPVFADVDIASQNITVKTISEKLTTKTKAIIAVHFNGWPCDMEQIMSLAKQYNLFVIEDCAQAHGAEYQSKKVGSWGHIGSFSFCQDKIMTTGGEGGIVTTNDPLLWKKLWSIKDHGKSYDTVYHKDHALGFRWLHEEVGTNWRMTEMQAAIGRCQLKKLPNWLRQRAHLAKLLDTMLEQFSCIKTFKPTEDSTKHANYKYYCSVVQTQLASGWSRDGLMQSIINVGVPCFTGSCSEIYQEQVFVKHGLALKESLKNAKKLTDNSLVFLISPTFDEEDFLRKIDLIRMILLKAQK